MFIVLKKNHTPEEFRAVLDRIGDFGCKAVKVAGNEKTGIALTGNEGSIDPRVFEVLPGVEAAFQVSTPYKLVSRAYKSENTVIEVNGVIIGGNSLTVIAGPCAIESEEQAMRIAESVRNSGADIFRGGSYKPRTSPYSFQGLGEKGLKILAKVRSEFGLPVVTEAIDEKSLELVAEYADIIQIGARNMQNFSLLKSAGRAKIPVMLKRGMSASFNELMASAEYIMSEGNDRVIICERGVKSVSGGQSILDLNFVLTLKRESHLPVFIDPSHSAQLRYRVKPLALAGVAAGVNGVMLEVHDEPERAFSDGPQAILPAQFDELMKEIGMISEILSPVSREK